jgi:hypothetical protein
MLDVTLPSGEAQAKSLEVFPRKFSEWQFLRARIDGRANCSAWRRSQSCWNYRWRVLFHYAVKLLKPILSILMETPNVVRFDERMARIRAVRVQASARPHSGNLRNSCVLLLRS